MSELSAGQIGNHTTSSSAADTGAEPEPVSAGSSLQSNGENMRPSHNFNIPGAEADPSIREAFWAELGRPQTPEGYTLSPGENATGYDTELADWFRSTAHDLNMPAEMAEALHDRFLESRRQTAAAHWQTERERGEEVKSTLSREWGASYDANLELAQRAVAELGGIELREALDASGFGDEPSLVRAFAAIGRRLYGGSEYNTQTREDQPDADPKWRHPTAAIQAQREILRLRSDEKFMAAYSDRTHPSHEIAQTQMDELYGVAYPPLIP